MSTSDRMLAESTRLQPAPRRWRMPPLVKASMACHLGAGALVVAAPALWPWAGGALLANHALLSATGLWPRSTWLGANLRRLPGASIGRCEVALTIDDGPDPEVTPAVLDLLDAHRARATFFCIAARASREPVLCREIVRRGHSVQNHSFRHRHDFSLLGWRGFAAEIGRAQDTLAQITGERPRFFRARRGCAIRFSTRCCSASNCSSSAGRDAASTPGDGRRRRVLHALGRGLCAGDIVLLHDGHAGRSPAGRPLILEVLPDLLQRFHAVGLHTVTLSQAVPAATGG